MGQSYGCGVELLRAPGPVEGAPAPEELVRTIADALLAGSVVGLPTDTVYGIGASIARPGAVAELFVHKGRPGGVPVALLVADEGQAWSGAEPNALARRLAAEHWPGGLPLVVDGDDVTATTIGSEDGSVGLRCPDDALLREVARRVGPIATTSAHRHGEPTPTTAAAVADALPDLPFLVDAGARDGVASTVVDVRGQTPVVLRQGGADIVGASPPE